MMLLHARVHLKLIITIWLLAVTVQPAFAQTSFIDVTDSAGLADTGIGVGFGVADFDGDADLDIYLVNNGENILYKNQGAPGWMFSNETGSALVGGSSTGNASGAAFIDYNNDGLTDILTYYPIELFRNSGDGSFENVTAESKIYTASEISSATFFDYDNDGDLDVYLLTSDERYSNRFLENLGSPEWEFIDRTSIAKLGSFSDAHGCIAFDYNNDGFQDLYVINQNSPNQLFENQSNGTFSDIAASRNLNLTGLFTGVTSADFDNDNDLDLYLTVSAGPNLLYQNNGAPDFSFSSANGGIGTINNGLTSAWGDFDNDGWLDLFVTNPYGASSLFRNGGVGQFSDVAAAEGLNQPSGSVAQFLDTNQDGLLDIYAINSTGSNKLFKNNGSSNNWIEIKLRGIESSRGALGARVTAFAGQSRQMRELNGQHPGAYSQHDLPEHFGLGGASALDSLHVKWPSGRETRLGNVPANRTIIIPEDEALPLAAILVEPEDGRAFNQSPLLSWLIPADDNSDSLHFRVEFAADSVFENPIQIDSWRDASRFSPVLPVPADDGTAQFQLPTDLEDGSYWWRVSAFDGVGLGAISETRKLIIDRVAPTNPVYCIEKNSVQTDVWQNFNRSPFFILKGAADVGAGIEGYQIYWGDDPEGSVPTSTEIDSFALDPVTDGQRYLRARTIDRAGNLAESWQTFFIHKYDATPPVGATAKSVRISDTTAFYINWEATARDDGGSGLSGHYAIRRKVDEGDWEDWKPDLAAVGLFDTGEHGHIYLYEVAAKDHAGNVEAFTGIAETSVLVDTNTVDVEPPPAPRNLQASGSAIGPWQSTAEFEISWTQPYDRSGISHCYYKLSSPPLSNADTSGSGPGTPQFLVAATEVYGQWLFLWLADGRGNADFARYDSVRLLYDPEPPRVTHTEFSPADHDSNWYNPHITTALAVRHTYTEFVPAMAKAWLDDSVDALIFTELSGGTNQKIEYDLDISALKDGLHQLHWTMSDSTSSQTEDQWDFYTDGTPPTDTRASSPDTSNRTEILVRWQGTGSDGDGVGLSGLYDIHVRTDSGAWQTLALKHTGESLKFIGEHGHTYDFEVAARDWVGNREAFLNLPEATTRIDTAAQMSQTPPEAPLLAGPADGAYVNSTNPALSWQVPVDANDDPLHFKVEISPDSLFASDLLVFDSRISTKGFSPGLPVTPEIETVELIPAATLKNIAYWWRVTAYDGVAWGLISEARRFIVDTLFPMNPTTCIDRLGGTSNLWQNKSNQAEFEWSGASDEGSGLAGYLVYWGSDPKGDSTYFTATLEFKPEPASSGRKFLRVRAVDVAGNLAIDWTTLFIFKFDNIPPRGATASSPRFSQGNTFTVRWGNTAVDSGGAGINHFYDVYVNKDSSSWEELQLNTRADSLIMTGEMGHTYAFEVAARDSAGNVEVLTGIPEAVVRVAPPNEPPEAPELMSPPDGAFIATHSPEFIWAVPHDADENPLEYRIEVSCCSTFAPLSTVLDSRKDADHFIAIPASDESPAATKTALRDTLTDGPYWWRVAAWDGLLFGPVSESYQFILDTTPPQIEHSPLTSVTSGSAIQISISVQDSLSGVVGKQLIYKQGGTGELRTVEILSENGEIPGNDVTSRGVEYAILATDQLGNMARVPESGFYSPSVMVGGNGILKETVQPIGGAQLAYRMISVPLQLNNPDPADVLQDDLGFYDRTKWRLFSYRQNEFKEFGFTADFAPGTSFWLIVKEDQPELDSGPGQTMPTDRPYSIAVDSAAWTMVANPFNFPIPLANVSLSNGESPQNFITYDGQWRIKTDLTELEPWEGYMIKTTGQAQLVIDPRIPADASALNKIAGADAAGEGAWGMQIKAICEAAVDGCNFIGIREDSDVEWDAHDLFEPPTIGEYVQVRFPHRDWRVHPDDYTTDYRPPADNGVFWDFEVGTNMKAVEVVLNFIEIDSIPADAQVVLIDERMKIAHDLRESWDYHFTPAGGRGSQNFRLIVGSESFVAENNLGASAMPADYVLAQNFPNPFNNQTMIRFFLPQSERVNLIIYNVLGKEISRLLSDETRGRGYHTIHWNGENKAGQSVASGVYFYTLKSGSGKVNLIRKMVYVR